MHCLPTIHDSETEVGTRIVKAHGTFAAKVTDEVLGWPASIDFDQAQNRLHMIKAVPVATSGPSCAGGRGPWGAVSSSTLQGAAAGAAVFPLDGLDAETEGMIGYGLQHELDTVHKPDSRFATLPNPVQVDADDPAFTRPTRPAGPVCSRAGAERLSSGLGGTIAPHGSGCGRVVASRKPLHGLEIGVNRLLVARGEVVICGGGIPVARRKGGPMSATRRSPTRIAQAGFWRRNSGPAPS